METKEIVTEIDREIARLQAARALLAGSSNGHTKVVVRKREPLSAAARQRIAEAQRKRWAKARKAAK